MDRYIISFYLGSGGNRFLQKMIGNNWNETNKSYDNYNTQKFQYRYLENFDSQTNEKFILTHNVNSPFIKKTFPDYKIIQICYDLQACLRREWMLCGEERYRQRIKLPDRIEHYKIFKDSSWPDIENLNELSPEFKQELDDDYKKVCNNIDYKKDSCIETIKHHLNYYKKFPMDTSKADEVIDLEKSQDEFAVFMKKEINRYQSEYFDYYWRKIHD